jgi:hypothetical protein
MGDVGLHILRRFGLFYGTLVYFKIIWYIFPFWYIFHVLVCCTKKNLAARLRSEAMHWNLEKETFEES